MMNSGSSPSTSTTIGSSLAASTRASWSSDHGGPSGPTRNHSRTGVASSPVQVVELGDDGVELGRRHEHRRP